MLDAVEMRRSIRKFLPRPIVEEDILEILESGRKAPSSKNRQPWQYVVVRGKAKEEMLAIFRKGIEQEESGSALLPQSRQHIAGARHTAEIMAQAPVIVFVMNRLGKSLMEAMTVEERVYEICNVQSIGASIENMLLAATEKGIGSLWIGDIYFAYAELCEWLHSGGTLVAAIAFGYPDEFPRERPRKTLDEMVTWRG